MKNLLTRDEANKLANEYIDDKVSRICNLIKYRAMRGYYDLVVQSEIITIEIYDRLTELGYNLYVKSETESECKGGEWIIYWNYNKGEERDTIKKEDTNIKTTLQSNGD